MTALSEFANLALNYLQYNDEGFTFNHPPTHYYFQSEATMRMLEQAYRGSMTSRVQRVRTGALLAMIRMVRMMRGAGAWRVLDGTVTGGALQAQVGHVLTTLPIPLSLINVCLYGLFQSKVHLCVTDLLFHCSTQDIFTIQPA